MKKPETKLKERFVESLSRIPKVWFQKIQQRTIRGTPDFLICAGGRFIAVELKMEKARDKLQNWNLAKVEMSGGVSLIVTPENMTDNLSLIKSISKGRI